MATSSTLSTITISFLLAISSLPTSFSFPAAGNTTTSPRRFSKIFAFGDSYTDTGNTRSSSGPYSYGYVSNRPYGITFFHHSTNRYSDGRLVVDFLATALSLPFLPPYLHRTVDAPHGVNFAVAGSTAIDYEFFVRHNITIDVTHQSLNTQLRWFEKYLEGKGCRARGSRECHAVMDDALFWVGEIGANDYAYSFVSSLPRELIRGLAIKNVNAFLQALLDRGAKHIVVQGLPLTGCLPLTMILAPTDDRDDIGCSASENNRTYTHNLLLQAKLRELRRRYTTATISYADYFNAHRAVMKHPTVYGFSERFKVCCGTGGGPYNYKIFATCGSPDVPKACSDPNKFVNWDGVHLTEAMYKAVAGMFFNRGYLHPPFEVLLGHKKPES